MLRSSRRYLIPASIALAVVMVITAFRWQDQDDYYYKLNKGLEVFGQVYREIANSYVDQVDPDEFIAAGIQGMLKTLDPYTVYMRRKESADIDLLTSGSYGGIGITVGMRDSLVTIVDVVDGYSAQREGVRIGDRILSIEGKQFLHGPLDGLREYTRGEPNTTLRLMVTRDGAANPLTFLLTRENIKVHSVSYSNVLDDNVGYIKLDRFSTNAGEEVRSAILEMQRKGSLGGLILDLRDNPGGLLESAVDVAAKFVPAGSVIVTTRGRDSNDEHIYRSTEQPMAAGIPLVVLVNDGSASASEIVAGAIQDLDAGVIMGTASFGKGLVQSVRRLSHDATLKLTTARYYTPSGRSIQKIDYGQQVVVHNTSVPASAIAQHASYRTKHGRVVSERGGIVPDSLIGGPDTTAFVEQLERASLFFNFATRYAAGMKSLPASFMVDDGVLRQFETYVMQNGLATGSGSMAMSKIKELHAVAQQAHYDQSLLRKIQSLEDDLGAEQRRLFAANRELIRQELYNEISGRFGDQRARIRGSLVGDQQITAAIELITSGGSGAYDRLLSVR
jgi:carboxyl-terminal processing protease